MYNNIIEECAQIQVWRQRTVTIVYKFNFKSLYIFDKRI